jgi:hypothetical protein
MDGGGLSTGPELIHVKDLRYFYSAIGIYWELLKTKRAGKGRKNS